MAHENVEELQRDAKQRAEVRRDVIRQMGSSDWPMLKQMERNGMIGQWSIRQSMLTAKEQFLTVPFSASSCHHPRHPVPLLFRHVERFAW